MKIRPTQKLKYKAKKCCKAKENTFLGFLNYLHLQKKEKAAKNVCSLLSSRHCEQLHVKIHQIKLSFSLWLKETHKVVRVKRKIKYFMRKFRVSWPYLSPVDQSDLAQTLLRDQKSGGGRGKLRCQNITTGKEAAFYRHNLVGGGQGPLTTYSKLKFAGKPRL